MSAGFAVNGVHFCLAEIVTMLFAYRFDKIFQRAKLKQSISRLVNILFPKLETLVSTLHGKAVYALLTEFLSAQHIALANLKHLNQNHITFIKEHMDLSAEASTIKAVAYSDEKRCIMVSRPNTVHRRGKREQYDRNLYY